MSPDIKAPLLQPQAVDRDRGGATPAGRWRAGGVPLARVASAVFLAAGPAAFVFILLFAGEGGISTSSSVAMAGVMAWMFIWWVGEAVPLPVTALLPLFLLPLLRIQTSSSVSSAYTNDTIFLIFGSFVLSSALKAHGLEDMVASSAVRACSASSRPRLVLAAFCAAPAFISMWLDNAAAAGVLIPVAMAVQTKLLRGFDRAAMARSNEDLESGDGDSTITKAEDGQDDADGATTKAEGGHGDDRKAEKVFCNGITLCVTFAITIGGMSTITGNAVNIILVGLWEAEFPSQPDINYLQWMLFGVPLSIALNFFLWLVMCFFFCPSSAVKHLSASLAAIARIFKGDAEAEIQHLSNGQGHSRSAASTSRPDQLTSSQITVVAIYFVLVVLWMTKSFTSDVPGWADLFDDYPGNGSVTILMITLLFVIPDPMNPKEKLMNWSRCKDIPWGIILLVGGGFALADGIKASGLSDVITEKMSFLRRTPYWAITPAIAVVTATLTEFTSNSAIASIIVPLTAEIALSMSRHPLFLMIPATMAAQFSYMLPVATGPNAIAYATESLRIKDMAIPGFFLKIIAIVLLSILMPTLGVVVFNADSPISI